LRTQITELISRYFAAIDDKRLDIATVDSLLAPGARIVRPNGAELIGAEEISKAQTESFSRFRATHHVLTDYIVDLETSRARVRANVIATHLWGPGHGDPNSLESHFVAGGVLAIDVVRLEAGWRIEKLSNRNVWRTGSGFAQMAATGKAGTGG
jgi:hypothetical protein